MELLLTILSVLSVWVFLTVLVFGLWLILKPLESVRAQLRNVAMGVRAIEQETAPLGEDSEELAATTTQTADAVIHASRTLSEIERGLVAAAPVLRRIVSRE